MTEENNILHGKGVTPSIGESEADENENEKAESMGERLHLANLTLLNGSLTAVLQVYLFPFAIHPLPSSTLKGEPRPKPPIAIA
jgi:hypothetical protein